MKNTTNNTTFSNVRRVLRTKFYIVTLRAERAEKLDIFLKEELHNRFN